MIADTWRNNVELAVASHQTKAQYCIVDVIAISSTWKMII